MVSYDKAACHLAGSFGTGKDEVVARFTRYQPSNSFDLGLYGKRVWRSETRSPVKLQFDGGAAPIETQGVQGNAGKLPAVFMGGARLDGWHESAPGENVADVTPEREAAVHTLDVSIRGGRPFRLVFGDLAKPFALMRDCTAGLVRSWGYDPDEQAHLLRPASSITNPVTWLNTNDYPPGAASMGHNGIVQFRLDVDAEGKPTGCYVLMRTNPDDFADATCRGVMRRAKLQPALDASGKATRSFYIQKVHWRMPG